MKTLILIACTVLGSALHAQTTNEYTINLWPNDIPNHVTCSSKEEASNANHILWITHVQTSSIDVYLPTRRIATGAGVLICPGGGYGGLAYDWEGTDIAKWLNAKGIAAFVLKYRLPGDASVKTPNLAPLQDAQRAMRIIKGRMTEFHLEEGKIGVMGFSAGGHLASTLGTQYNREVYPKSDSLDQLSARPDFMTLVYPVISMKKGITHEGSQINLLGKDASEKLINQYSNELQVTKDTPPTFLIHATDDGAVPVQNSLLFFDALTKKEVPVEMHLFPKGGHGFAFGYDTKGLSEWTVLCYNWIQALSSSK